MTVLEAKPSAQNDLLVYTIIPELPALKEDHTEEDRTILDDYHSFTWAEISREEWRDK